MNFPNQALVLLLAGALAACNGDPKETAYTALQSGDFAKAADLLGKLATEAQGTPEYIGVAIDHCRALAHTEPDKALSTFLAVVEAEGKKVTPKDYRIVGSELAQEDAFDASIKLLEKAGKVYPDDPMMQALFEKVKARAEQVGDPDILARIKSLPYAGG